MKRLWVLITACLLLFSSALGETVTTQGFTADEQAYNVYLDISTGYSEGVKYLEEIEYLWRQAIELGGVEKADSVWFNAQIAAGGGELDITHMMRYQQLAQLKYGYADYTGLYDHFTAMMKMQTSDEVFNIVRAALPLSIESGFVQSAESLETYLDEAKAGIRTLMKLDPDYSFTEDLQNYYKELNLLLKYVQDFNATYSDFKAKTESFAEKLISYEVDFEFVFDSDEYENVRKVRSNKILAAQKVLYDQAVALENAGEYDKAIGMYWQCLYYEDARERIEFCKIEKLETKYQQALLKETLQDYMAAIDLFVELGDYKDCSLRQASCMQYTKGVPVVKKIYIAHYSAYKMPSGTSETEIYTYNDDGTLASVELKGVRYGCDFSDLITYSYEDGLLTTGTHLYATNGTELIDEYIYDEHGEVIKTTRISSNGDTSKPLVTEYVNTYNAIGEIESQRIVTTALTQTKSYIYEYDKYGNKISVQIYQENPIMEKKLMSTTTYVYDRYGRIEKEIIVFSSSGTQEILYYYH